MRFEVIGKFNVPTHPIYAGPVTCYICTLIKTHGSELQGQERAKQIAKNKTHDELLCVFYTSERIRNMTS